MFLVSERVSSDWSREACTGVTGAFGTAQAKQQGLGWSVEAERGETQTPGHSGTLDLSSWVFQRTMAEVIEEAKKSR